MENQSVIILAIGLLCIFVSQMYFFGCWLSERSKRMDCERDLRMKDEVIKHLQNKSVLMDDDYVNYLKRKKSFAEIKSQFDQLVSASKKLHEALTNFQIKF